MKYFNINEENWKVYRKTDKHLPEKIMDQNLETICFLNERKYDDTIYEEEEIEFLELKAKIISKSPKMYLLLSYIYESEFDLKEIKKIKEKIKQLLL